MTLQKNLLSTLLFASTSWFLAGCAIEVEGTSEEGQRFEMVEVCDETVCQSRHAKAREQCNECLSIAQSSCVNHSLACNTASACSSSCSGTTCTESTPPVCKEKGFAPKYPERDEALFIVLEQFADKWRACNPNERLDFRQTFTLEPSDPKSCRISSMQLFPDSIQQVATTKVEATIRPPLLSEVNSVPFARTGATPARRTRKSVSTIAERIFERT